MGRSVAPSYLPLAGHDCQIVDVQGRVEQFGAGSFQRMPYTARVFAENLVRCCDPALLPIALEQVVLGRHDTDFPFYPARVVLQDLLGTPALVDLAGLRDAIAESGGDPTRVNPVVTTQLVVDHSLNVDVDGMNTDAMSRNMSIEQRRNAERFELLCWARRAFHNVEIVMHGNGILHQINLERLSPVVVVKGGLAFADTLVGTDSHTTMIDALGVVGWGVGGIEAESTMLGRPIWMRLPQIIGVELVGQRKPGVQATDLVLAITEYLRSQSVVNAILEFHGEGAARLPLADRATISNMAPEFGATAAMFAIDERTLDFPRLTGRPPAQIKLVESYARAQGLWADSLTRVVFDRQLRFDLSSVERALAGPSNPHDRIPLRSLKQRGLACVSALRAEAAAGSLPEGAIVIAAITSCTNTSNPRNVIAAGLLARKALERGLQRKPWVKTSFAPGAIAGSIRVDILHEPLATDCRGLPVMLDELWPSDAEIDELVAIHVRSGDFTAVYEEMFTADPTSGSLGAVPARFPWRDESTYIRRPPYWQAALTQPVHGRNMRVLAMLGDNITTDDLSPSGAILAESASGQYLMAHGVQPADFNSYGTRRGHDEVAVRATLANNRLKNEMTPEREGSFTRIEPEGVVMPLFQAAQIYRERGEELVVIAGQNYGCGSSRDWAAKGVRLLGVRAVICESFERIHRSNLVGMGILPLEFGSGTTRRTLGLDGSEIYTIEGLRTSPPPGSTLILEITRPSGVCLRVPVRCRIDTDDEPVVFKGGGLLAYPQ